MKEAGIVVAVGCFALLFVEGVLAATWNRTYFSSGIPLFRKRVTCAQAIGTDRLEEDLNLSLERARLAPLVFRQLEGGFIAFRERAWPFPIFVSYYVPLMHGAITRVGPEAVQVTGRANWAMPLVFAAIMARTAAAAPPLLVVWGCILALMYILQAMRFRHVALMISQESP